MTALVFSLLLPYFEASLRNPQWDTTFTVTNTTAVTQIARVTVWTDRGMPVVFFPFALAGHATVKLSIHDLLNDTAQVPGPNLPSDNATIDVQGCVAERLIPAFMASDANCMLTSGLSSGVIPCNGVAGDRHTLATGYVTIDAVRSCSLTWPSGRVPDSDLLGGSFEQIAAGKSIASGNLVKMSELSTSMTIEVPAGATELHVWRAPSVVSMRCEDFARAPRVVTTERARKGKVTKRSNRPMWIVAAKPSPPDPTALPPPRRCPTPPKPPLSF
jgi:hypothetical protein